MMTNSGRGSATCEAPTPTLPRENRDKARPLPLRAAFGRRAPAVSKYLKTVARSARPRKRADERSRPPATPTALTSRRSTSLHALLARSPSPALGVTTWRVSAPPPRACRPRPLVSSFPRSASLRCGAKPLAPFPEPPQKTPEKEQVSNQHRHTADDRHQADAPAWRYARVGRASLRPAPLGTAPAPVLRTTPTGGP